MARRRELLVDLDNVTCPICLEVYQKPVCIKNCGHNFCSSCLKKCNGAPAICPLCRQEFNPSNTTKAKSIENNISSHDGSCTGCHKVMRLSRLRSHLTSCKEMKLSAQNLIPVAVKTSKSTQSVNQPNRHTFSCPYCGLQNFDVSSLREHCNNNHRTSTVKVVCPICASFPWGNPDQVSLSFINHLNYRHQFEYDNFVDYEIDEDTALRQALAASQEEM